MCNQINLCKQLKNANAITRTMLAEKVVDGQVDLLDMASYCLPRKALRLQFLWLLTDVGQLQPKALEPVIDEVYEQVMPLAIPNVGASFANYWLLCPLSDDGVGKYCDVLLQWATGLNENVTTRKRAQKVVMQLGRRFPEIEQEMNDRLRLKAEK